MKTRIVIPLLFLSAVGACYAKYVFWNVYDKPDISLTEAHTKALEALKSRNVDFYCLSAVVARTFSKCDWELHFGSTNNTSVWVSVGTDRVRVSESMFAH